MTKHARKHLDPRAATARIKERDRLWVPNVIRGAELIHPKADLNSQRQIRSIKVGLGSSSIKLAKAGNRHVRSYYKRLLFKVLKSVLPFGDPRFRPWFVTVIVQDWDVSEFAGGFKHHAIKLVLARILGACSWVGLIELVRINNAAAPKGKGKRICVHVHLLIWGDEAKKLRRAIKRRGAALPRGVAGADPISFREVPDEDHLAFRLAYMFKMPVAAKRLVVGSVPDADGELHPYQFTKTDSDPVKRAAARMYILLNRYRLRDLICCGGGGKTLIRNLERKLQSRFGLRLTSLKPG